MPVLQQATITKADIVNQLSHRLGLPKSDCKKIVDVHFEVISKFLESGTGVKITGLGKFSILKKNPRLGRNPKTLVEALITGRYVVSYRSSQKINTRISKNSSVFKEILEETTG